MSSKASPTLTERFKSQGRRPRSLEVLCSGIPLGSLAGFWDGGRTLGDQLRGLKSKRIEEIATNVPSMFEKQLDCQLVPSCSCPLREQGPGWFFLFLNMNLIWIKKVDSLRMWLFMTCDVNDGVLLFSLWQHLVCGHLLNQRIEQDWTGIVLLAMAISALLGM